MPLTHIRAPRSLLLLTLSPVLAWARPAAAQSPELVPVEVATVGVELASGTPIAILRDRSWGQLVPIWIGTEEAQAMARAIRGERPPRPMTHDLLASAIGAMGGTVVEVAVHGVDGQTYLGRIRIRIGSGPGAETRDVDSRPSDALALALRTGARVQIARSLVQGAPEVEFVALDGRSAEVVRTMGMTVAPLTQDRRREFALEPRPGVVVLNVSEELGGLGLARGDLIVDVNGDVPTTPVTFLQALAHASPAVAVRMVYVRDGVDVLLEIPPGVLGRPEGEGRPRRRT